ncbi:MAG: recombination protein RecR [Aeriscardovia sp.]|nr:recombination protein RecR [Aeriscardovia sp.]
MDIIEEAIEAFSQLPGIGPKSAKRIVYSLLSSPQKGQKIESAIERLSKDISFCKICGNVTDGEVCKICADPSRENVICVVGRPLDVMSFEKTGVYRGRYHVLGGLIDPMSGVGPEDLRIRELRERVEKEGTKEVILALDSTVEGEATSSFLSSLLRGSAKISRLASGVPVGSELEYTDELTLSRALTDRMKEG